MFISITFTKTGINETDKIAESQRLKIFIQHVHHSREHMRSNDYTPLRSRSRDDGVHGPAAFTLSADVLSHGSANGTPAAAVHQIQIWRIGWLYL